MKRYLLFIMFCFLLLPVPAFGAREFAKVGTIGGQFLKIPMGARPVAMGSAYVSLADDANSVFWNPAGIARLSRTVLSIHHTQLPAEVGLTAASYVFHVGFMPGALAVSARSLHMPEMQIRTVYNPEGTPGYSFDAGDVAFGLTYGRSLTDKFSTGLTFNYVQSTLYEYTGKAYTFDFGTLYDTGYQSLRIGMVIQNIGSDMKFIEDVVKMPSVFRVGMSMRLYEGGDYRVLSSAEFNHPPDNNERANWGMELGYKDFFYFRGGYNFKYDAEGLALGIGVKIPTSLNSEGAVDYAFVDQGDLGGVHRISIDFRF
ncbi:MAG: PorV/PorQ family protein [Candidatus Eisenbacteria bacterium]|nr:PorV/PorQ family protein [Candidatus Eisenbacteria bacterium]